MAPKEQTRLQVLNNLLTEHLTLDQAATLMGVSTRHTRRLLATHLEKRPAAVAYGHRGRRPRHTVPEDVTATEVILASEKYVGFNHNHVPEVLAQGVHSPEPP